MNTTPLNFTATIWDKVRKSAGIEANAFTQAWLDHQTLFAELEEKHLLPGAAQNAIKAMEREDASHLSPDELIARADKLSTLRRIAENQAVQSEARRSLNAAFLAMAQPLNSLASAVDKSFVTVIEELKHDEEEFFAAHGLPHEPTALTRTAEALRQSFTAKVEHFDALRRNLDQSPTGGMTPTLEFELFSNLFETAE